MDNHKNKADSVNQTEALDKLALFWDKKIDSTSIKQDKISHFFNLAINLLLVVIIISGVAHFLLIAWELDWNFNLDFFTSQKLVLAWAAILAVSYLLFRVRRVKRKLPVMFSKAYGEKKYKKSSGNINVADSFDDDTLDIVFQSWQIARQNNLPEIESLCLLLAVFKSRKLVEVMARLGVAKEDIVVRVENLLKSRAGRIRQKNPVLSETAKQILLKSYELAAAKRLTWVGIPSLLLAIVVTDRQVQDVFADLEIDNDQLTNVVNWLAVNDKLYDWYKRYRRLSRFKPKNSMNRSMTAVATPYLDRFSHDLTLAARYGNLELTVGRQRELDEIFRIIESGTDSVVLVGYPGVGKTAIINGIAQMMVTEDVPEVLRDKRLVSLSLPRLIAGATSPGILEERVLRMRSEIVRAGNVVLVVENIHDIYGVNSSGGEGLDLSEVFADVISDDRFLVITTSTPVDYRKSLSGKALGNALQKVEIVETDKTATLEILAAKVNYFEYKYRVYFSFAALDKSIDLADRYLHDFWLPEKAIKILEETAVYVLKKKGEKTLVAGEDVAALISEKVHIPLTKITENESAKLLNLEDDIHRYIINQEEAVSAASAALRRARTELRDESRPIVNLLFLGPTGVGKTELAKTIAITYFGNRDDMVRLDMSEYQDKASVRRLIGTEANPNEGLLTNGVKQNPYTVLLLDEIEKAHPDILNVFLQVMDDGRLTDWSGRVIDFTNVIIVATSNAGADFIQDAIRADRSVESIKEELITTKLKGIFRPEFLNRFDNIVVFKSLSEEHIKAIAKLMIKKSQDRLMQKGIHLEVSEQALSELAQAGFDPAFGARPMRRVIQEKVDDALARYLLSGKITRRDIVVLEAGGKVRVQKAQQYV